MTLTDVLKDERVRKAIKSVASEKGMRIWYEVLYMCLDDDGCADELYKALVKLMCRAGAL